MKALISGANRGIGREVARQLAKTGKFSTVVVTSRVEADGLKTIEEFKREGLNGVDYHSLDVSNASSIQELCKWYSTQHKVLDVLVNNAGAGFTIEENTTNAAKTIATNYQGAVDLTNAFKPLLNSPSRVINVSSGYGKISEDWTAKHRATLLKINVSMEDVNKLREQYLEAVSRGNLIGYPMGPTGSYKVSKAFLNAYTRILSRETRSTKLFSAAVCPGWVRTRMGTKDAPRSVERGAETITWLAHADISQMESGRFWRNKSQIPFSYFD